MRRIDLILLLAAAAFVSYLFGYSAGRMDSYVLTGKHQCAQLPDELERDFESMELEEALLLDAIEKEDWDATEASLAQFYSYAKWLNDADALSRAEEYLRRIDERRKKKSEMLI